MFRRFLRDQQGVTLVLVTVMLPVIMGFALLVIDRSRAFNLHSDLQKAADALALAGAAELDGNPDAFMRSDNALQSLLANQSRFSDEGAQTVRYLPTDASDVTRRFLWKIPASDADPIDTSYETADPASAMFIEVTVKPVGFDSIFPAELLGGDGSFNISATAVAGFAGVVTCNPTPIFICNPFPTENLADVANENEKHRKSVKLVIAGETAGPGNFGFLRPISEHGYGETDLADDLARETYPECVSSRALYTQTGNFTEKARAAINTRFDMYKFYSKDDASVAPAPNIRRGYDFTPKNPSQPGTDPCAKQPGDPTKFAALGRDSSYTGQIGTGMWDYEHYVAVNQFTTAFSGWKDDELTPYSNANPPSRYDVYIKEIEEGLVDQPSIGGETGVPMCAPAASTDSQRRLIHAAIVDCAKYEDQLNGQSGAFPALGFASFFITEPVGDDGILYTELVDIAGNEGRGTMKNYARDAVQLYR